MPCSLTIGIDPSDRLHGINRIAEDFVKLAPIRCQAAKSALSAMPTFVIDRGDAVTRTVRKAKLDCLDVL